MSIDHEKIKRLISLVEQHKLTELAVEEDGLSITIKAEQSAGTAPVYVTSTHTGITSEEMHYDVTDEYEEQEEIPEAVNESLVSITSPMIGVFYRRPSPDSASFVEVGDSVEVGQTIGLIEAMKVFSEVPSEVAGVVVQLPVDSGKLVQQGDVLIVIDTSSAEPEQSGG
ncbi:MAG: acetyl-CoA carboxylase [Armatimonadota bacterium]